MDIKVPTEPYLKRYLHYWYPMPYKLRMDDVLGCYLYYLLRDPQEEPKYIDMVKKYTVKYSIRLRQREVFSEGVRNLTPYSIYRFNSFVEELFLKELYAYLEQSEKVFSVTRNLLPIRTSPFTNKHSIYRFLAKYSIDQGEKSYQTLKKSYYRYKKNKNKHVPNLSPEIMLPVAYSLGQKRHIA